MFYIVHYTLAFWGFYNSKFQKRNCRSPRFVASSWENNVWKSLYLQKPHICQSQLSRIFKKVKKKNKQKASVLSNSLDKSECSRPCLLPTTASGSPLSDRILTSSFQTWKNAKGKWGGLEGCWKQWERAAESQKIQVVIATKRNTRCPHSLSGIILHKST